MRRLPSKAKGLVTTATVSAPSSLARFATTGAAPLPVPPPRPAGDEHHVRAVERFENFFGVLERGLAADLGIGARAQTLGEFRAELQLHRRLRKLQRLQVGVGGDEFDAFDFGADHAVDGVRSAASHADDFDLRAVLMLPPRMKLECSILLVPCFLPQIYRCSDLWLVLRIILGVALRLGAPLTPPQTCFSTCPPSRWDALRRGARARPVEHQSHGRRIFGLGNLFAHFRQAARRQPRAPAD